MDPCFSRLPGDSLKYRKDLHLKYATSISKENCVMTQQRLVRQTTQCLRQTMVGDALVQSNALKHYSKLTLCATEITQNIISL